MSNVNKSEKCGRKVNTVVQIPGGGGGESSSWESKQALTGKSLYAGGGVASVELIFFGGGPQDCSQVGRDVAVRSVASGEKPGKKGGFKGSPSG